MKAAEGQKANGNSEVVVADKKVKSVNGSIAEGVCGALSKRGSDKAPVKAAVSELKVDTSDCESEAYPPTERVSEEETRAYEGLFSAENELPYWQSSVQAWSPANARDFDILTRVRDACSQDAAESDRSNKFQGTTHIASPMSIMNSSAGNDSSFAVDDNGSPSHRIDPFNRSCSKQASCRSPSWMRESIVRDLKFLEDEDVTGHYSEDPYSTIPPHLSLPHVSPGTSNVASNRAENSASTGQESTILSSQLSKILSSESERCPSIDPPSDTAKLSPQPLAPKEAREEAAASVASSADTAVRDEQQVPKEDFGTGPGSARSATSAPASSRGRSAHARATPLPLLAKRGVSDSDLLGDRKRGAYLGGGGGGGHAQLREKGPVRRVAVVGSMTQAAPVSGDGGGKADVRQAMGLGLGGFGGGGAVAHARVAGVRYAGGPVAVTIGGRDGGGVLPSRATGKGGLGPPAETLKVRLLELNLGPSPVNNNPPSVRGATVLSRQPHQQQRIEPQAQMRPLSLRLGAAPAPAPHRPRFAAR